MLFLQSFAIAPFLSSLFLLSQPSPFPAGRWRVRRWGLGKFASEGFGEEGGGKPIGILTGTVVLGFNPIGLFELWDRRGQADSHEKSGKVLGEML
jgi:hypothetical protein